MSRDTADQFAAAAMLGAALLHFAYTASNNDDPAALIYAAIGVVQLGLAAALVRHLSFAKRTTIWLNIALAIAFIVMETAGPALGMEAEPIGPLTVLRKGLEVSAVAVLLLEGRRNH